MRIAKQIVLGAVIGSLMGLTACGSGPVEIVHDDVVLGVSYVGVSVTDLDASEAFYSAATDLAVVSGGGASDAAESDANLQTFALPGGGKPAETRLMRGSNAQLMFMQFPVVNDGQAVASEIEVYGPGIAHVCYQVAKSTRSYQRFLAAGAKPIGDPAMVRLRESNPVEYAYARDPDGLIFEVEHVEIAKLDLPKPPKHKYRVRHVSFATSDMDRILGFYSVLLGGQEPRRAGNCFNLSGDALDKVSGHKGAEIEMGWLQSRNLELEFIQYYNPKAEALKTPRPLEALGYNMVVFDVVDIAAAGKRFTDAGGTVVSQPTPIDGGKIMFGRDPDGNLIGLQKIAAGSIYSSQNFDGNGT